MHFKNFNSVHQTFAFFCFFLLSLLVPRAHAQAFDNIYSTDEDLKVGEYNQRMMMALSDANFIAGTAENEFGSVSIPFAMKTDLNGNVLWAKKYLPTGGTMRVQVVERSHDSKDFIMVCDKIDNGFYTTIIKVNGVTGNVVWSRRFDLFHMDVIQKTSINGQNAFVVVGEHYVTNTQGAEKRKTRAFAFADNSGAVIWSKHYFEGTFQANEDFNQWVTGFHPYKNVLGLTGKYYISPVPGVQDKYLMFWGINMQDGSVFFNSVNYYSLDWLAGDMRVETDSPFTWDLTPLTTLNDSLTGFAISGSYVFDNLDGLDGSGTCVIRLNADRTPNWASLYHDGTVSIRGHGRKVFQSGGFLRVATLHRIGVLFQPGFLTVNANNGNFIRWRRYENAASKDIRDGSMVRRRVNFLPGHVFWRDLEDAAGTTDEDFEIISVRNAGAGSNCEVLDTLPEIELEIEQFVNELGFEDITTTWVDDPLEEDSLIMTVTPCDAAAKTRQLDPVTTMDQLAKLWPNPVQATGEAWNLGVQVEGELPVQIRVVDAMGRTVMLETRAAAPGWQEWTFSARDLASGMYLVTARQGTETLLKTRLVRQ